MANLKLIKVTGSPFCDTLYGCIGIQVDDNNFNVIKGGGLNTQSSYSGCGWQYATAEEIAENWKLIYPHWTPERGDNVIVTQDYGSWANQRGIIVEASSSKDYYRVKRCSDDRIESFDYTCQMILAPYNEIKVESKETTMTKFKEGDRVKCIQEGITGYGKVGTVLIVGDTSVGVKFDENVNGHFLDGMCSDGYGWWIRFCDLELVTDSKPKEETVIVRFLTEQEFKGKGLWNGTAPKGWNSRGDMNKYLGQSIVLPKSKIRSNGSFTYEDWTFSVNDYIVTEEVSSSKSISTPVIATKPDRPSRRFKVGDKVTYKSLAQCGGDYRYGGSDQGGFVGTVESEMSYESDKGCYGLRVTTKRGDYCYNMLESEFHEYDFGYAPITSGAIGSSESATRLVIKGSSAAADGNHIFVSGVAYPISHYSSDGSTHSTTASIDTDPLSSYKQKPIIIKSKPKSKLITI